MFQNKLHDFCCDFTVSFKRRVQNYLNPFKVFSRLNLIIYNIRTMGSIRYSSCKHKTLDALSKKDQEEMSLIVFFFSILTSNRPRGNVELFMKRTNLPTAEGFWAQDQSVERLTAEREIASTIPRAGPTFRVLKYLTNDRNEGTHFIVSFVSYIHVMAMLLWII